MRNPFCPVTAAFKKKGKIFCHRILSGGVYLVEVSFPNFTQNSELQGEICEINYRFS